MKKQNRNRFRLKLFLVLAVVLLLAALFSRPLCPYDPDLQNLTEAMKPPGLSHPFGTDRYGRDLLSRVLVGGRTSIFSALFLVLVTAMAGTVVGMAAGWAGGILDTLLMRLTDLFLAFPGLVFALAVAGVLGGGLGNAVLALAVVGWPKFARLSRSLTLAEKALRGQTFRERALEASVFSCASQYFRPDPGDGRAGYRNHDHGAGRPLFPGTWSQTAHGRMGEYDQ